MLFLGVQELQEFRSSDNTHATIETFNPFARQLI